MGRLFELIGVALWRLGFPPPDQRPRGVVEPGRLQTWSSGRGAPSLGKRAIFGRARRG